MRTFFPGPAAGERLEGTSLCCLVHRLCQPALTVANNSRTTLFNEIPPELLTIAEEAQIGPVIEEVLHSVIRCAKNGKIHITAERFRDLIVVEIEERNNYNGYALACTIQSLQPLVREIGGELTITGQQELFTTISLAFLNESRLKR